MTYLKFNRDQLLIRNLSERKNKVYIEEDYIPLDYVPGEFPEASLKIIEKTVRHIKEARKLNRSVMLAFGAHTIKNGLGPALIALIEQGWITHLATNGAGIIHDWEFAWQGQSSEDVRENVYLGQFGIWDETGYFINLALIVGAYEGLGYGEAIGKMIFHEGLDIPEPENLFATATEIMKDEPAKAATAIELANVITKHKIPVGYLEIPHPYKKYSVQGNAFKLKVPFTGHPMFGHDIIYTHPISHGASIGRTAENDFLCYAKGVSNLDGGVYISMGSAVMSPMIFEKSLSMSQNIEMQHQRHIDNHYILVVDLAKSDWDWKRNGEPPIDNPAYYLRYCKTFNRMGGDMDYMTADNRDFILALYQKLNES